MNVHLLAVNFDLWGEMKKSRELIPQQLSQYLRYDIMRWFSWGAKNLTYWRNNGRDIKMCSFNVSGHEFKGHIVIFLNASDLFDVYFFTNRTYRIVNSLKDLYFDQLAEQIDIIVENPAKNYQ